MGNELVPIEESPLSPTLRTAIEASGNFMAASRSAATRRAYASDWRAFETWCAVECLITLPASPGAIAAYVSALATAEPPAKLATIRRRVAAIAHMHRAAGLENPCQHQGLQTTLAGIARTLGAAPEKKQALTADMVARVVRKIPFDLVGLRDRALILVGFAAALRRSELVGLDLRDIGRHPKGLTLTIRRSKTDQAGAGVTKAIPFGKKLKAVEGLQAWVVYSKISDGPIFRSVRGNTVLSGRLDAGTVARLVKKRAAAAGLDPKLFAGHSLRSGFISSAADHGASLETIARHANHARLDTTRGYVQVADAFKDHAGRRFL